MTLNNTKLYISKKGCNRFPMQPFSIQYPYQTNIIGFIPARQGLQIVVTSVMICLH